MPSINFYYVIYQEITSEGAKPLGVIVAGADDISTRFKATPYGAFVEATYWDTWVPEEGEPFSYSDPKEFLESLADEGNGLTFDFGKVGSRKANDIADLTERLYSQFIESE